MRYYVEPKYLDYYTDFTKDKTQGNTSNDLVTNPVKFNKKPTAVAGGDQLVQIGDNVSLNGSESNDLDGDSLTYLWELIDQPLNENATIFSKNSVVANFTPNLIGRYDFLLKVQDDEFSDSDNLTVWVQMYEGNHPPEEPVQTGLEFNIWKCDTRWIKKFWSWY